ncbi:hypothetical protein [Desulfocurvus vexinensis]|uniref:VpaChn25_0724 family phage protein n=1 Tax=Desulfocurvus vexinensis TaxID=399548 RepID=UPI00048BB47C|nr:hypothetical protein [Desulfocurvus vexinensis]
MSYATLLQENRRLEILRALAQDPDYELNAPLLQDVLRLTGLGASADQVRTDVAWLAEQGLVTVRSLETVPLVRLTGRGCDVAAGLALVPGVARPRPE